MARKRRRKSNRWIQKVHLKKGALHKQLGVPEGESISLSLLNAAIKKGGLLAKRAQFALNMRKIRRKKK